MLNASVYWGKKKHTQKKPYQKKINCGENWQTKLCLTNTMVYKLDVLKIYTI